MLAYLERLYAEGVASKKKAKKQKTAKRERVELKQQIPQNLEKLNFFVLPALAFGPSCETKTSI